MNEKLKTLRAKAMRLPLDPGVYIMKDKNNKIIYIGKAKKLKNRVSQYFGSQNNHPIKVRKMVENVEDFDFIVVKSEFEALVLECSLIKQHTPKYNILLKDDKGYHYIKIAGKDWKNLSSEKQKLNDSAKYLGPYTSSDCVSRSVSEAQKIFRLPTCGKFFPDDINKKGRPCLNFHIKLCNAPCVGKVTREEHNRAVDNAVKFITGGNDALIRELKKQMEDAAENLEFEKAASLRDSIQAIEKTAAKQTVVSMKTKEQDVFAVCESLGKVCLSVLRFSEGRLYDSEYFFTNAIDELPVIREKLIADYYSMRNNIPSNIAVDGEVEGIEALIQMLSEKKGRNVRIYIPEKGENASLMKMCSDNAAEKLAQHIGRSGKTVAALDELGNEAVHRVSLHNRGQVVGVRGQRRKLLGRGQRALVEQIIDKVIGRSKTCHLALHRLGNILSVNVFDELGNQLLRPLAVDVGNIILIERSHRFVVRSGFALSDHTGQLRQLDGRNRLGKILGTPIGIAQFVISGIHLVQQACIFGFVRCPSGEFLLVGALSTVPSRSKPSTSPCHFFHALAMLACFAAYWIRTFGSAS